MFSEKKHHMKAPNKPGDLIKRYSTTLVEGLVGKISASSPLRHRLTKGKLRELFVTNLFYNPASSIYGDYKHNRPLCAAIGFYGRGSGLLMSNETGRQWLKANCWHIFSICLVGRFSWINLASKGWSPSEDRQNYEEIKRFIAVFLDNLRILSSLSVLFTVSELRLNYLAQFAHKDWLSVYIREQEGILHFDE